MASPIPARDFFVVWKGRMTRSRKSAGIPGPLSRIEIRRYRSSLPEWAGSNGRASRPIRTTMELKELGYAYAIVGGAGPVDYYVKVLGGIAIPGSVPGVYPRKIISD